MSDEDLSEHVNVGDVLAACRGVRADVQAVVNERASRTSASVQGFTSLMLRVTATVRLHDLSTMDINLVFKQLPFLPKQREHVLQSGLFDKEVTFYRDVVPLLRKRCLELPLVECYFAQGTTMALEDLGQAGYVMLVEEIKDMGREGTISLAHVRLVARRLAQYHAASLGTDWHKELPQLQFDPMFMGPCGEIFRDLVSSGCRTTSIVMRELMPESTRHADWLLSTSCLDTMARLARPSNGVNVLCHGDCHVSNMMFKHDEHGNPVDVKLLDMQLVRYAPPSRDLLYFLYTSTSRNFRLQFEQEILRTYVEAFNAAARATPDVLTLDDFTSDYEASRMYGCAMALNMKPSFAMSHVMPDPGQALSSDKFESVMLTDHSTQASEQLRTNPEFKKSMTELIDDTMDILNKIL